MKILQLITRSELGGAQSVVINLANELSKSNEVIVAAGEGDGKMWELLNDRVVKHQCKYLQRAISPIKDFWALFELWRLYKKYKPDVIHLHSSKAGLLCRIVFPSERIVYTVHGFDSIRVAHRKMLPLEKIMSHFCASIVGVSQYDYNNLINEGITNNVSYIYNGISRPEINNLPEIKEFSLHKKNILAIARVFPPKKPDLFIDISKRLPQYGFIWIGNQRPMDIDMPSNCYFVGNIPNAGAYCSKADVFCLPSNYEGLPMVILEALSFGKPVVASNVGGISEILDGENGFAVENTIEEFVEKIDYILKDNIQYNKMCKRALETYNSLLTVDHMVEKYSKIYENIYNKL